MKPGWKTTEFWLTAITWIVSLLFMSGMVVTGTTLEKALTFVASALSTLGYSVSRGIAKASQPALPEKGAN